MLHARHECVTMTSNVRACASTLLRSLLFNHDSPLLAIERLWRLVVACALSARRYAIIDVARCKTIRRPKRRDAKTWKIILHWRFIQFTMPLLLRAGVARCHHTSTMRDWMPQNHRRRRCVCCASFDVLFNVALSAVSYDCDCARVIAPRRRQW